jgi:hypothetical protein
MPQEDRHEHAHYALVVCKDTGAANAFSAFFKNLTDSKIHLSSICVDYAVNVFKKNGLKPTKESPQDLTENQVEHILDELRPDALLLGTSFDSWTERYFCKHARERGIPCVGFVDWWSNFGARFSTPQSTDLSYMPNAIAVMDEDARLGCIADGIPKEIIHIIGNPYWDDLIATKENTTQLHMQIRKKLGIPKHTLLAMVFSSNIRNLPLHLGYDEYDFWDALLPLPEYTCQQVPIQWALKPHPRESRQDNIDMMKTFNISPLLVDTLSGIEAIAAADFVIGMCSSVLFEAALLGKKVVSLQPGLSTGKLEYLRIFDRISVPKIVNVSEVKGVINRLLNDDIAYPTLTNIPTPIGKGTATAALQELLIADLHKKTKRMHEKGTV